jgi:hypothetical protein
VREAGGIYADIDGIARRYNQANTGIKTGMAAGPHELFAQFSARDRERA